MWDTLKKCHRKYLAATDKVSYLNRLPHSGTYQSLVEQLNLLSFEDLGLDGPNDSYYFKYDRDGSNNKVSGITVSHIQDTEDYSIILLFMKKGERIPLHDHEEMTVLTRVLNGKLKYRALDKIHPEDFKKDPLSKNNFFAI